MEHTDEVIRRKKSALAAFEKSEAYIGYQEVEVQIEEIDKKLEEATRHARELEKRCETITATLEAREKEFWSSGGDLSRNRDAIKQEMKKISEDVEKIQEEILQLLIDASTPLFMCKDLVVQSFNSEKALQESEAVRHSTKIITDLFAQIMNRLVESSLDENSIRIAQGIVNDELLFR